MFYKTSLIFIEKIIIVFFVYAQMCEILPLAIFKSCCQFWTQSFPKVSNKYTNEIMDLSPNNVLYKSSIAVYCPNINILYCPIKSIFMDFMRFWREPHGPKRCLKKWHIAFFFKIHELNHVCFLICFQELCFGKPHRFSLTNYYNVFLYMPKCVKFSILHMLTFLPTLNPIISKNIQWFYKWNIQRNNWFDQYNIYGIMRFWRGPNMGQKYGKKITHIIFSQNWTPISFLFCLNCFRELCFIKH